MEKIEERIRLIEEEIRRTPYHKGTEHHIGKLRARIARLKDELVNKSSAGGGGGGFAVGKTGDASVVLVGFPSVGKSTLINKLTNASSKVGAYDFTTLNVIPGMMDYQGVKIQIFDIPGIISGAAAGKGRGKEVISVIRTANLIIIILDPKNIDRVDQIKKELFEAGVRLDRKKPKVTITKSLSGGIKISTNIKLPFSHDLIKEIAKEFRISNGEITIKEPITLDQLIDTFIPSRAYFPSLTVLNKIDLIPASVRRKYLFDLEISAEKGIGLEELKEAIWKKLELARVYLKPQGGQPDMKNPFIIHLGESLQDIISRISICNKETFRFARIFGPGAKFPNQEVPLTFIPQEGTIVEFAS
jgi:small GTP-binding protein